MPLQDVSAHREVFDAGEVLEMIVTCRQSSISDGSKARDLKIRNRGGNVYLKLEYFLGLVAAELPQGEVRHRDAPCPVDP